MTKHHQILSITDSWYYTWKIYSQHFFKFILITALPILITDFFLWLTIGTFTFSINELADPRTIFSPSSAFIYYVIIAFIFLFFIQIWSAVALIAGTIHHKELKFTQIYNRALHFFWRFILFGLFFLLITTIGIIISYIIIFIIAIIAGLINLNLLVNDFSDLYVVSVLVTGIISFFAIFAPFFIIEENAGPMMAIRKSYRLVRSFFWPLIIRVVLVYCVLYTMTFLIRFIPYAGNFISVLIATPLLSIYTYTLYINIKPKYTYHAS